MTTKRKPVRDAYTFSLAGMNTIASFHIPTAVADDRLTEATAARLDPPATADASRSKSGKWGRFWLRRRHGTT